MNEEEYELYEMQQRKKDMAAKYAKPKKELPSANLIHIKECKHEEYEFIEQENEINMTCDCNCMKSTDKWECMGCGIIGYTVNINHQCKIEWSE